VVAGDHDPKRQAARGIVGTDRPCPSTPPPGGAVAGARRQGAFRTISTLAAPGQRAGLIAAYFIASYTAFSIPVVIAGVATTHFGLQRTAPVYCTVIAVLAAVAAASLIFRGRARM
jgi:hypothetical protein